MKLGPHSRILGVDDAPFRSKPGSKVMLVGVLMRASRVDGVMTTHVVRDGMGATKAIARMISTGRLAFQAQAVVLDGVAVGGFNVIDLPALAQSVGVPVVSVMRRLPDFDAIRNALDKTRHGALRWKRMQRAGAIHEADHLYFQVAGASPQVGRRVVAYACAGAKYPESLRLAHLIGGGVMLGVSRGGA